MNRGAWKRFLRIGRQWNGELDVRSRTERPWSCQGMAKDQWWNGGVWSSEFAGFRGLGDKAKNERFMNVETSCRWQEDLTVGGRNGVLPASADHLSLVPPKYTFGTVSGLKELANSIKRPIASRSIQQTDRLLWKSSSVTCLQQPKPQNLLGIFPSITSGLLGFHKGNFIRDSRGLKDFMTLPKGSVREISKVAAAPPQMQKPMKLRLFMGSPGVIGEPYKKPAPPLPFLRRWFTREGWTRRKQSFMGMIKTSYTIAKLRQKTKGYSQQKFYQEVSDLYKQINTALAEGERTALRHLVTDSVFSVMKNELKHRESTWAKVDWEMVGPINKIRTLQGRLIGVDKNNHDNAFVQLTLKILSKQKFAAYDKRGKLVLGDPAKELLVEDYWVFEKPLLLKEAKWRLCGRLNV